MPPAKVLRNEQRLGARVIVRAAEQLATHFNPARIALAITSAVHGLELSLCERAFSGRINAPPAP